MDLEATQKLGNFVASEDAAPPQADAEAPPLGSDDEAGYDSEDNETDWALFRESERAIEAAELEVSARAVAAGAGTPAYPSHGGFFESSGGLYPDGWVVGQPHPEIVLQLFERAGYDVADANQLAVLNSLAAQCAKADVRIFFPQRGRSPRDFISRFSRLELRSKDDAERRRFRAVATAVRRLAERCRRRAEDNAPPKPAACEMCVADCMTLLDSRQHLAIVTVRGVEMTRRDDGEYDVVNRNDGEDYLCNDHLEWSERHRVWTCQSQCPLPPFCEP
jgi:hypothetical protein